METMIQDVMDKAIVEIQKKQEDLIKQRLFEFLGYELDIIEESKRRFPRLKIESKPDETSYYWNNDSIDGIRIITFVQNPIDFSGIENLKLSTGISYF